MDDKITQDRIALLHPRIRTLVSATLDKLKTQLPANVTFRITQGLRTFSEQDNLFKKGRSAPGPKVTNARGGESIHNYGLAIDFVLVVDGKISWEVDANWKKVAEIFKHAGFTWGGEWKSIKDYPHLEITFGYSWQQLLDKYRNKDFIAGTQYVNL